MKPVLTTLVPLLLLAGCDRRLAEFPEDALRQLRLRLRFDSPAEVTGYLPAGAGIADAVQAIDPATMRSVSIVCSPEDSVLALPLLAGMILPVSLTTAACDSGMIVGFTQDGLTWQPGYAWTVRGDSAVVTASVTVRNLTGRPWTVTGLVLSDDNGAPVCGRQGSLVLPEGDLRMAWWEATGTALPVTLVYGQPIPGQWNALQPLLMNTPIGDLVGTVATQPDLPIRTGDTLWIPAPEGIVLEETLDQFPAGYYGSLEIRNDSSAPLTLRLSHPEILPRGAEFVETRGFGGLLHVVPAGSATVEYTILYRGSS